jgi:hypothetical protein
MRFIKSGLLTMLVSLFILGGCKNPSQIGLDVDPKLDLNSTLVDTSTVVTKLLKEDSVLSNFTSNSVLGYFKDPIFGTTTSNIAVALSVPSVGSSFGKNPILDSAVLVLPFLNFYGDSINTAYNVEVRQLNEVLYNETNTSYYNTKKWAVKSALIGSKNFYAAYKDSIIIQDIIVGKKDTVKKVIPQLRIKLDPTFITNNILKLDSTSRSTNKAFNNYIKGLYISLNKTSTANNGGLFSFDTNTSGKSRLDLFYKSTSTTGTIDTLSKSFNIEGSRGFAASEITWDLSSTPVKTELESQNLNNKTLYFKGLNGTKVKVEFPYLNKIKELGKNIAINRAELVLKVVNGTETPYAPISQLRIYRWDIANRPQFLPDENPSDPRYIGSRFIGGFYDKTHTEYVFNMTGYLQDLLNGKTINYGTFLTSNDFTNGSAVISKLGRSVTGGAANVSYKAKLRIYYTDLK